VLAECASGYSTRLVLTTVVLTTRSTILNATHHVTVIADIDISLRMTDTQHIVCRVCKILEFHGPVSTEAQNSTELPSLCEQREVI
jgi:hypothetical protein